MLKMIVVERLNERFIKHMSAIGIGCDLILTKTNLLLHLNKTCFELSIGLFNFHLIQTGISSAFWIDRDVIVQIKSRSDIENFFAFNGWNNCSAFGEEK